MLGDVVSGGGFVVPGVVEFGLLPCGGACVSGLVPGVVVLPGVVVVPGLGEAVPGVGEAVPGVGAAVPGVGEAVPEFGVVLPGVLFCPGLAAVPGVCPLCEAEPVPDCPALDPAVEPAEPADPACPISGVKRFADNTEPCVDWAINQHVKSSRTDIIEIFVFMGLEASKGELTPQFAFYMKCRGIVAN